MEILPVRRLTKIPRQYLFLLQQSDPEIRIRHCLNGAAIREREMRSQGGGLAEDHENRFHANGAVGNVRRRQADRNEKIFALAADWNDGAIADGVGRETVHLHVALVARVACLNETPAV